MEKMFFYDLETTGLDPKKNAIHQISAVIRINNTIAKRLDIRVRPFDGAVLDPVALEIGHVTEEQIMAYPSHQEAYKQLTDTLGEYISKFDTSDKLHLCGYNNMSFDNDFLRNLWNLNDDKYFGSFFWSDSIDVMSEASSFLRQVRPRMKNFKLKTVAALLRIDINESKLHDASYDTDLTMEIFDRINLVRKQVK